MNVSFTLFLTCNRNIIFFSFAFHTCMNLKHYHVQLLNDKVYKFRYFFCYSDDCTLSVTYATQPAQRHGDLYEKVIHIIVLTSYCLWYV